MRFTSTTPLVMIACIALLLSGCVTYPSKTDDDKTVKRAAAQLDSLEKVVERWGTASISDVLVVEDKGQFSLDYNQPAADYVQKARESFQGAARRSLERATEVQIAERAKFDATRAATAVATGGASAAIDSELHSAGEVAEMGAGPDTTGRSPDGEIDQARPAFQSILKDNAAKGVLSTPQFSPPLAIGNLPTGISERRALLIGLNDKITENILKYLAHPTGIDGNKSLYLAIMQVSVNPGWGTRKGYIADITVVPEYWAQEQNVYSLDSYLERNYTRELNNPKEARITVSTKKAKDISELTLLKDETVLLTAQCENVPTPAHNDGSECDFVWMSEDLEIVSVDNEGKVTGKKSGKTTITVSANVDSEVLKKEIEVNVTDPELKISPPAFSILPNRTVTFSATSNDECDKKFQWEITGAKVASVDPSSGRVTGLKKGTTEITAKGLNSQATKTATIHVDDIAINPYGPEVVKGRTVLLTAMSSEPLDTTFTWVSSDQSIATVYAGDNGTAVVNGNRVGITNIQARGSHSNNTSSVTVTVTSKDPQPKRLSADELRSLTGAQPTVLAAFPLMEAQTADLRNSERTQRAFTGYLSSLLLASGQEQQSEQLISAARRLEFDAATRSPIPTVASYSLADSFSFQFIPTFHALGDPADKKSGSENILQPYSFPAVVLLITDNNEFAKGKFDHLLFSTSTRWIPINKSKRFRHFRFRHRNRFATKARTAYARRFDEASMDYARVKGRLPAFTYLELDRRIREVQSLFMGGKTFLTAAPFLSDSAPVDYVLAIEDVYPRSGGWLNAQTLLVVRGKGFTDGKRSIVREVTVGGRKCEATVVSDGGLVVNVPPWQNGVPGDSNVTPSDKIKLVVVTTRAVREFPEEIKFNQKLGIADPEPSVDIKRDANGKVEKIILNETAAAAPELLTSLTNLLEADQEDVEITVLKP